MVEVHLTPDEYTDDQVRQILNEHLQNNTMGDISEHDLAMMQKSLHTEKNDLTRNEKNEAAYIYLYEEAEKRLAKLMDRDFDMVDADELNSLTEFANQFSSLPNMDSLRSKISNRAEVLNAVSAENSAEDADPAAGDVDNAVDTPETTDSVQDMDETMRSDTPSSPESIETPTEETPTEETPMDESAAEVDNIEANQVSEISDSPKKEHTMQDLIKKRQELREQNGDVAAFDSRIIHLADEYAQSRILISDMNEVYDFHSLLLDVYVDQTDEQNREILHKALIESYDKIYDFEQEYGIYEFSLQSPQVIEENLAFLGSVPTDEEIFEKDIDPKALKEASPEEAQKLIEQAPLKNPEFQDIKNILDAIEIKGKDKDKNHKDLFLKRIRLETDMYMANTQNPVSVSDYMEGYALRLRKGLVDIALTNNTALAELKAQDFEESFNNLAQAAQGKKKIQIQSDAFTGWQTARQNRINDAVDRLGQKEGYKPVAARFKEKIDNLDKTLTKQLGKKYTTAKIFLKSGVKGFGWGVAYSAGAAFGPVGIAAVGAASLGINGYKFIQKVRADKKAAKEKGLPYKFWSTENALSVAGLALTAVTPLMGGLQMADLVANTPQIASAVSQSKLLAGIALGLGGALHSASKARAEIEKARQEAKTQLEKGKITQKQYLQMLKSYGSPTKAAWKAFGISVGAYAAGMGGGMTAANAAQIGMPADMASVEASAPESSVANPSQEATISTPENGNTVATPSQEATIGTPENGNTVATPSQETTASTPENGNNTNDAVLEEQALTDKTVDIKIKMQPYALKAELESQGFDVDKAFSELGMDGAKPTSANMQTLYNALQEGKLDNVEGLDSGAMRDAIVGNAKDDFHSWRGEDDKLHSNWNEGHQPTNTQTASQNHVAGNDAVAATTEGNTAGNDAAAATTEGNTAGKTNNNAAQQTDSNTQQTGADKTGNDSAASPSTLSAEEMATRVSETSDALAKEGYVFHDTEGLVASVDDNLQRITDVDPSINGYKENYDADGNLTSIELGRVSETSGSQQHIVISPDGKVLSVEQNGHFLAQENVDNINNHPDNYPLMNQTICEAEKIHAQFHSLTDQVAQENVAAELNLSQNVMNPSVAEAPVYDTPNADTVLTSGDQTQASEAQTPAEEVKASTEERPAQEVKAPVEETKTQADEAKTQENRTTQPASTQNLKAEEHCYITKNGLVIPRNISADGVQDMSQFASTPEAKEELNNLALQREVSNTLTNDYKDGNMPEEVKEYVKHLNGQMAETEKKYGLNFDEKTGEYTSKHVHSRSTPQNTNFLQPVKGGGRV